MPPKALDSIAGLLIPFGIFSSGFVPIPDPTYINDLIVVSPFFHYKEVIQCAVGIDCHNQVVFIHMMWLALYTVIAGFIAKFAYQRDSVA